MIPARRGRGRKKDRKRDKGGREGEGERTFGGQLAYTQWKLEEGEGREEKGEGEEATGGLRRVDKV